MDKDDVRWPEVLKSPKSLRIEVLERLARYLAGIAGIAFAASAATAVSLFGTALWPPPKPKEDLAYRIQNLTGLLNTSARAISNIESEIAQRQELVKKLENDAETAKRLSAVSREQAEAIAQTLRGELEKKEPSFWSTHLTAVFYTLLGVALAEAYHYVRRIRRRRAMAAAAAVAE